MSQFASDKTRFQMAVKPTLSTISNVLVRGCNKMEVKPEASEKVVEPESKRVELEKVNNIYGCVAGAGSNAIPIYRKHRNHELERLRQMDFDWDHRKDEEAYQAAREEKAAADDAMTDKKREKRQKRKAAKAEYENTVKAAKAVNQFESGGSFLEQMMAMAPEELEKQAKKAQPVKKVLVGPAKPEVRITAAQMSSATNITVREIE
eukprot:TRINITY_DN1506_c0_g1_i1.p2 TRINITY_DN1506_c0_g1~~TRINITY_DN1506_c0_g1_i1.p2  ORF type:complete len:206 (+),score=73.37 TRINITY_DN1506_c0_g1_i1:88-705(+)